MATLRLNRPLDPMEAIQRQFRQQQLLKELQKNTPPGPRQTGLYGEPLLPQTDLR